MTQSNFELAGRRVLVTGAASGIGRATAHAFAELGCRLAVADLEQPRVDRVMAALPEPARRHLALAFDLADAGACEASVQAAADGLGGLDIVVHAGAMLLRQSLDEISPETLQRTTAVNMWGTFFVARKAAQLMAAAGGGSIILFSSQGAYTGGYASSTAYAMTKAAVTALIKALAREFADKLVRVNGIAPGAVDTPMLRDGVDPAVLADFMARIPLGRPAEPAEMASCCVFLASPASGYMTGQVLHANGGQLML